MRVEVGEFEQVFDSEMSEEEQGKLQYWRPVPQIKLGAGSRKIYRRLYKRAISRKKATDPLPVVVSSIFRPPSFPKGIIPASVSVMSLSTLQFFNGGFNPGGYSEALAELKRCCRNNNLPVVIIPVSMLLAAEPSYDSMSAPVLAEFLGRLSALTPRLILFAGEADLVRLSQLPTEIFRVSPPACPPFLHEIPPGRQVWFGTREERERVVDLLLNGRHVIITGPPGTGKTAMARSLASDSRLAKYRFFQTGSAELISDTAWRGVQEKKFAQAEKFLSAVGPRAVCLFDEYLGFYQRSGSIDTGLANDSINDFLKTPLAEKPAPFLVLATATDQEYARLRTYDPASTRRFVEIRLNPPNRAKLQEVIRAYCRWLELPDDQSICEEVIEAASLAAMNEASPAAEIKFLHLWADGTRDRRPLDFCREKYGFLSAPNAEIFTRLETAGQGMVGRERELVFCQEVLTEGMKRLLRRDAGEVSPLMALTLIGPRGSGKKHFADKVGLALAGKEPSCIRWEQAAEYVSKNGNMVGGVLIIEGEFSVGGEEGNGPAGRQGGGDGFSLESALSALHRLNRWVLIFVCHLDRMPELESKSCALALDPFPFGRILLKPVQLSPESGLDLARRLYPGLSCRALRLGYRPETPDGETLEGVIAGANSPHELEEMLICHLTGEKVKTQPPPGGEGGQVIQLRARRPESRL